MSSSSSSSSFSALNDMLQGQGPAIKRERSPSDESHNLSDEDAETKRRLDKKERKRLKKERK